MTKFNYVDFNSNIKESLFKKSEVADILIKEENWIAKNSLEDLFHSYPEDVSKVVKNINLYVIPRTVKFSSTDLNNFSFIIDYQNFQLANKLFDESSKIESRKRFGKLSLPEIMFSNLIGEYNIKNDSFNAFLTSEDEFDLRNIYSKELSVLETAKSTSFNPLIFIETKVMFCPDKYIANALFTGVLKSLPNFNLNTFSLKELNKFSPNFKLSFLDNLFLKFI